MNAAELMTALGFECLGPSRRLVNCNANSKRSWWPLPPCPKPEPPMTAAVLAMLLCVFVVFWLVGKID